MKALASFFIHIAGFGLDRQVIWSNSCHRAAHSLPVAKRHLAPPRSLLCYGSSHPRDYQDRRQTLYPSRFHYNPSLPSVLIQTRPVAERLYR